LATRREILRIAGTLAAMPTVSYREHEVHARIRLELDRAGIDYAMDRYGNLLARYRRGRAPGRATAFCAHMDHPGFIIEACVGRRAHARWIGGVLERYFMRSRVSVHTPAGPVRGSVIGLEKGPTGRVTRIALSLERSVAAGAIGTWDLDPFVVRGDRIHTRAADDLLGCSAILSMFAELAATRPALDVWGVFTRAEEDGLYGASAVASSRGLPPDVAIVSLETSKELPCGRLGQGVIVRVGDRMSVFDPVISGCLLEATDELKKRDKRFRAQRGLMDGGVCEASTFQAFGYAAGALALPLGNYHNMGEEGIAPEIVSIDDLLGMTRLLPLAAKRIASRKSPLAILRAKLSKNLAAAKKELVASRALVWGLLLMAGIGAGPAGGAAAPQPDAVAAQPPSAKSASKGSLLGPRVLDEADPLAGYDALRYDISLRIDPPAETIAGSVVMRVRALTDLDAVEVDCGSNLTVDSTRVGGLSASFSRPSDDMVSVTLPEPLRQGDSVTITLSYHGGSIPSPFSGFEFFSKHGTGTTEFPVVSTMSEPDYSHVWWPCKDRFDDKALASLTIDAPSAYVVVGFGLGNTEESPIEGRRVTRWETVYPITPYLVSFAASNYVGWSGRYHVAPLPFSFYAYPEDSVKAAADWSTTGDAVEALENYFGPYPFRSASIGIEKLGVVEYPWRSGAMENQTIVFMGDGLVTGDRRNDTVLAHEIAHQWFGDAVTPTSPDHIWLNEGFATYGEALYAEFTSGTPGYRARMMRYRHPVTIEYRGALVQPEEIFNSTVYRKGAWVLHMLRGVLGPNEFFHALQTYYQRYEYANASTDDFVRAVEETVGRDLRWFFIPWLYGEGRPRLAWDWSADDLSGEHQVRLMITQIQDPISYPHGAPGGEEFESYRFPLQVRLFGAGDSLDREVFVGRRSVALLLEDLPFRPDSIALDPDQWLLREIAPRGSGLDGSTTLAYPNPSPGPTSFIVQAGAGAPTRVGVFDAAGRRVRSLTSLVGAGAHSVAWDGRNDRGDRVASGMYWLRASGPSGERAIRVVVIR
jgi:aminopeptidase N